MCAPLRIADLLSYDGALLTGATFTGPVPGSITTAYDNFLRPNQLGVNGSNVAYAYDADGLLTGAGSMTLARDAGNGLVTGTALGQIATTQSYDGFGHVSGFTAKQGSTVLFDEQYQRDNAGHVTMKTVTMNGQANVYGYAYDAAGRLVDVTRDGIAIGHFEYDANGNRTSAYGITASYDDQDRLVTSGSAQYSHTANGELSQITSASGTTMFGYDVSGNLLHVALPDGKTLDYLVDGRNRRIGKKVNGALVQGFLYQDQLKPAAELDAAGNVVSRFVYAGKANVPEYMVKGGITYRIISDQLGSVRLVINSTTGQIAQRIDYDEWGNVLGDSNPGFQPFGFAGGLYDRDTGLVRCGARDYDPRTGRWTVKDPIGFNGGDASLFNYVGGDPVSGIDPTGLKVGDWWDFPANLERAHQIALEEVAKRPTSHNNLGDAMRHAEWMRRTTQETNSCTAWIAGTGHELGELLRQPLNEMLMDLHNNAVGRDAGKNSTPVDQSKLWTLPLNGSQYNPYQIGR